MKKIAIIGLGLIGGSLLKSLQNKGYNLYAVSKNPETVKKVQEQNLVMEISSNLELVKGVDLIFIATPIETIIEVLEKIKPYINCETIIADLASVKGFIMDYANNTNLNFIGLHPMAGTEDAGFDNSDEKLFENSKWAVIPSDFAKPESVDFVKEIIKKIGAKPVLTDAKSHDKATAMVSHLPLVLSQALFSNASTELDKTLSASGFRDMTRLAMSNSKMARDMIKYNKKNILECLTSLEITANNLLENYETSDIEKIAAERRKMYTKDGKNLY